MKVYKVTSVAHLKELCTAGKNQFFLLVGLGLRSNKYITYACGNFCVINEIDFSEQLCSERELSEETNIVDGIEKGAFYCTEL